MDSTPHLTRLSTARLYVHIVPRNELAMQVISGTEIEGILDHERQSFCDFEFNRCTFAHAGIIVRDESCEEPAKRATVRNIRINDCRAADATLDGAIIENVTVHNLQRGRAPIFLRANAYKHVTLSGKIAVVEIRGKLGVMDDSWDGLWDDANARFYEPVDWALDISEARFASLSISGVPSRLIRRDHDTTAVVTREKAIEGEWRKLAYNSGLFSIVISTLVHEGYDDTLLIACSGSSRFKDQMEDLNMLRQEGIAT